MISNQPVLRISNEVEHILVADIPGLIAAALEPFSNVDFSEIKQAAIMMEHEDILEKSSLSGVLIGRNALTRAEEPFASGEQLKRTIILIDDFVNYLSRFGLKVEVMNASNEGRFNLFTASKMISEATGESQKDLLKSLTESAGNYEFPMYVPGSKTPCEPMVIRDFHEEVYWDDLNKWLDNSGMRFEWRFSAPNDIDEIKISSDSTGDIGIRSIDGLPAQRVKALRKIIEEEITENNFNPNASRWPKTELWLLAVKRFPELFPKDADDRKEGLFHKAYTEVKREYK